MTQEIRNVCSVPSFDCLLPVMPSLDLKNGIPTFPNLGKCPIKQTYSLVGFVAIIKKSITASSGIVFPSSIGSDEFKVNF